MEAQLVSKTPIDREAVQFDVAFKLILAARRFRARFAERMKGKEATDARCSALYMLADAPDGLIQSELAERMGVQNPTLVRLLDTLERAGQVRRVDASSDRRAKIVVIEDAGRRLLEEVDGMAARLRDKAFAGVSDADLQTTLFVLDRLCGALDPSRRRPRLTAGPRLAKIPS